MATIGHDGLSVTADRGATWTAVSPPGSLIRAVAAPDGSFRVLTWRPVQGGAELQLHRLLATGQVTALGAPLPGYDGWGSDIVEVAEDGSTWLGFGSSSSPATGIHVTAADGTRSTITLDPAYGVSGLPSVERTALGMRAVYETGTFRLENGRLVPAERHPVNLANGAFLLSARSGQASWDSGAHWAELPFLQASVVPRAAGQGAPRYLVSAESRLIAPFSPSLLWGTGLVAPRGSRVSDAGEVLVAWNDSGVHLHHGPVPDWPTAVGTLPEDTRRMVERANLFRADAGLPPLAGDELISRASRNHSRYLVLNGTRGLAAHREERGKPGFTGVTVQDRCVAVGTTCGGEVISFQRASGDGVGNWLATAFHRFLPASPVYGTVGAAYLDGAWTMNGGERAGRVIGPIGYPNGRWRGDAGFDGEVPDPAEVCRPSGQRIARPYGVTVTLYVPDVDPGVSRIAVRRRGEDQPLRGCFVNGHFIPDDPLTPGATYDAEGDWSPGGVTFTHRWSFTFEPEAPRARRGRRGASGCRLARRAPRRVSRRAAVVPLVFAGCGRGASVTVQLRRGRRVIRLPLGKRRVASRTLRGPVRRVRVRLPATLRTRGVYTLKIATRSARAPRGRIVVHRFRVGG